MKIRLFSDETIDLNLPSIQVGLANTAPSATWALGKAKVRLAGDQIEFPKTYRSLPKSVVAESADDDHAFIFTEKPYDNNSGSSPPRVGDFGLISYRVEHAGEDFQAQVLLVA